MADENSWLVEYARLIWVKLHCDHNRSSASSQFIDHHEIFKSLIDKIRTLASYDFIQLLLNNPINQPRVESKKLAVSFENMNDLCPMSVSHNRTEQKK